MNLIKFFYYMYYRPKIFFPKKTYSMYCEDIIIEQFFKNKKKGFYVDIGAHHPIQRNNTQLLFQKGWEGINIDINNFSIDLFNFLRPNDLNILTAISDKEGEIIFYYQKNFSQLNTTNKQLAIQHFNGIFKEKSIKCNSIDNVLKNSKYKARKIDFLNIDVEGAEMDVLKKLDFKQYDPSLICIEILGYRELERDDREKKIKEDYIYKFLVEKGYKKVWSGSSYCSHLFTK